MAHYDATPHQTLKHAPDSTVNSIPIPKNAVLRETIDEKTENYTLRVPIGQNDAEKFCIPLQSRSHHSRLDKSQSTPAYESIVSSEPLQERKTKETFFQRQNRVEEESEIEQKTARDSSKLSLPLNRFT